SVPVFPSTTDINPVDIAAKAKASAGDRGWNYLDKPQLDRPVLIMGFSGWANAGAVSSESLDYLQRRLKSRPLAIIEPDFFHDYTSNRPTAQINSGRLESFKIPRGHFSYVQGREDEPDLILFSGPEPNLKWNTYCEFVLDLAREMKVQAIFTLGGTYDYVPHWAEPKVSAICSGPPAEVLLAPVSDEIEWADYEGPISIQTMIMLRGREMDLPVAALWSHAPVYIQTGNIKMNLCLVEILSRAIGFSLDTSDLRDGVVEMEGRIEALIADNPSLKKYIDDLDREFQTASERGPGASMTSPSSTGGGKVIPFDRFLRREDQ
ncbi:MAG: PAC2 family protein, partial [Thermodesulfobacteriota bacterium]|nr:PAC2 family protein [Thermodesulfobacteriota bacterium]